MTKDEALKLALSALNEVRQETFRLMKDSQTLYSEKKVWEAIYTIKKVLAQPYQEPVAYGTWDTMLGKGNRMMMVRLDKGQDGCTVPLYTTPPQRKPLTDEQIDYIAKNYALNNPTTPLHFARAIEALHNIKETEK